MQQNRPAWQTWHYIILWIIALASLFMNLLLVVTLLSFRARAGNEIAAVANSLGDIQLEDVELPIKVDQTLTISMTVPFSDTFFVPISQTVPISMSILFTDNIEVPIHTVIPINTTINVPINLGIGPPINLPIPINTEFPVNLDIVVPISRTIPISTTIPVILDVVIPIQSDIPIQTEIPVRLDFPVNIPLGEFGLDELLGQVQAGLLQLAKALGWSPADAP